jgi:hypothetical protein
MHLDTLRLAIARYARVFEQSPNLYLWDTLQRFQSHWDIEAPDLANAFDKALDSPLQRRLWSAHAYQPKEILLHFIRWEPEQVRAMFRDLFDQQKDTDSRLQRFRFQADQLLADWHDCRRKPLFPAHDQDTAAVSLYLSMMYPSRYAPYDHLMFTKGLRALRVSNIPSIEDPLRWFKLAGTVWRFLKEDKTLMSAYNHTLANRLGYIEDTLLLSYDFFYFVSIEHSDGLLQ